MGIPGMDKAGGCADGGSITYFPGHHAALAYYHADYGHTAECDFNCMATLYRNGVDETVRLLISSSLLVPSTTEGHGGMKIVTPGDDGKVATAEMAPFGIGSSNPAGFSNRDTTFYDVAGATSITNEAGSLPEPEATMESKPEKTASTSLHNKVERGGKAKQKAAALARTR